MAKASVFDIADWLIDRSGEDSLSTVKLQKLCFYAFGWYGHLTGDSLFPEQFYAMDKGPVVGELLSAHAAMKTVSREQLMPQLAIRDGFSEDLDPYLERVLEAVWTCYGPRSPWDLVDLTHQEKVWSLAWTGRRDGSKRADLIAGDIVDHFLSMLRPDDKTMALPMSTVSVIDEETLAEASSKEGAHAAFVSAIRGLRVAS